MDDCEVCHGSFEAIPILDPVDVEEAYSHIALRYHSVQWHGDHMDGVMRALARKKPECKKDLFFAVKLAQQKLSKYYAEVTSTTGMFLVSAHILNPFR